MKKLIGILLAILVIVGATSTTEAKVVLRGNKTYITLDKTEMEQNKLVLQENYSITNYRVTTNKNNYTVRYKSCKSAKATVKQVKEIANELHGSNIEKRFKEFRTYNIKVIGIDKQGKTHTTVIKGHKIIK